MRTEDLTRLLPRLAYAAMALFYLLAACLDQQISFSIDSWSYQELARSFAGDAPYQPVLLRSFWSLQHSASFPPGYPYLLHLVQGVFGDSPLVAVWLCVAAALLTPLIGARLARVLGMASDAGLLAGVALLGYGHYFDEVLAARSIPLALAAGLGGLCLLLESRSLARALAAGALLGFACLVRFDQLLMMLLAYGLAWRRGTRPRWLLCAALASLTALLPWMVMSWQFFGRIWASDNSWVALASTGQNVTQFPAASPGTLFNAPLDFAMKCLHNLARLGYFALRFGVPGAWHVLALVCLWAMVRWRERGDSAVRRHADLLFIVCAALLPQVLTGYSDPRYLSMLVLVVALLCLADLYGVANRPWRIGYPTLAVAAVSLALLPGAAWVLGRQQHAAEYARKKQFEEQLLASLARCQSGEPQVRYVFPRIYGTHAARYAAQRGGRSSLTPSGFEIFSDAQRREFETALRPMRYVRLVDDPAALTCEQLLGNP